MSTSYTKIQRLNNKLQTVGDWMLTTEGLKSEYCKTHLRIADYGVCDEYGETVFIGTREEAFSKAEEMIYQ